MRAANQILDESFLEMRAKLLEVAATLDRIDRSADEGSPLTDQAKLRRRRVDHAYRPWGIGGDGCSAGGGNRPVLCAGRTGA